MYSSRKTVVEALLEFSDLRIRSKQLGLFQLRGGEDVRENEPKSVEVVDLFG